MQSGVKAEVITIGDEILYGQITDTNTKWIGAELTDIGILPVRKTSVGDIAEDILAALHEASERVNLVIITGGLGPTKDDITKHTLCRFFETELELNEEALEVVTGFFTRRGREITDINKQQAFLPKKCTYIENSWGTAPGMWFEEKGVVYVSLPGVPFEMKNLMTHRILPKLKDYFDTPTILHKMIRTIGIGESFLAERIEWWENELPKHIRLAYLPSFSGVKLRLTGTGTNEAVLNEEIAREVARILPEIKEFVYGYDNDEIESIIGTMLQERNASLSTAESCTGGFIAHKITSIPGSSSYFLGSVVSYSNELKTNLLKVREETLAEFGAVSEETVIQMAEGVRKLTGSTYGVATSGIAGPDGGTEQKPVGTVWIACATPEQTVTRLLKLSQFRDQNIELATTYTFDLLRKTILKEQESASN